MGYNTTGYNTSRVTPICKGDTIRLIYAGDYGYNESYAVRDSVDKRTGLYFIPCK